MNVSRKLMVLGLTLTAALILSACKSSPPPSNVDNFTVLEMMQRAQERSEAKDWNGAEAWYTATLEKFADDIYTVTSCRYELAFLAYKRGDFAASKALFEALVADFSGPEGVTMPPHFLTLSRKVLATIAEKTAK